MLGVRVRSTSRARPRQLLIATLIAVSAILAAAAQGHAAKRPAPPERLTARAAGGAIKLDWAGRGEARYFELYRRTGGREWRKPYARVRRSRFTDRKVERGRVYEYRVRLRDRSGERSNPGPRIRITATDGARSTAPGPTPPTPREQPARPPTQSPAPAPSPIPTPAGDLGPARATERDCNGATTSITAPTTPATSTAPASHCPPPHNASRSSADKMPTSQLKGVKDIYIGGRPGALMNAGPRTDGNDLLQIKRWPVSTGTIPDGITLRWIRFHDVTRPGSEHPDGIQVMAGRNGKILDSRFERVDIQPIFFRYAGEAAGGGPIEDWPIDRTYVEKAPNGYYAIRVAGNGDNYIPTRLTFRNLNLTGNVSIDRSAYNAGFQSSSITGGTVDPSG